MTTQETTKCQRIQEMFDVLRRVEDAIQEAEPGTGETDINEYQETLRRLIYRKILDRFRFPQELIATQMQGFAEQQKFLQEVVGNKLKAAIEFFQEEYGKELYKRFEEIQAKWLQAQKMMLAESLKEIKEKEMEKKT